MDLQLDKFKIIKYDELDSTNLYLKRNFKEYNSNTIIQTDFQNNGKGQFERIWQSNIGENLLFSLLLKDVKIETINYIKESVKNSLLTLLLKYNIKGHFKEPNDILVQGKKILGILIETKIDATSNLYDYVIIGIGININQINFKDLLATSFKLENNKEYLVDFILKDLLEITTNYI